MLRKTLLAAAAAMLLGTGFTAVSSIAVPTKAEAQWRDYDRPYYRDRGYYGERRAYRNRGYGYGYGRQGYRGAPVYRGAPAYRGGGVAPRGNGYGYAPGQVLPGGRTYTTPGGSTSGGGSN